MNFLTNLASVSYTNPVTGYASTSIRTSGWKTSSPNIILQLMDPLSGYF